MEKTKQWMMDFIDIYGDKLLVNKGDNPIIDNLVGRITEKLNIPMNLDKPWPTEDVLKKLIWATEYLLHEKNYDGHNYEELEICVNQSKELLTQIAEFTTGKASSKM